jgi:hypothetical protein
MKTLEISIQLFKLRVSINLKQEMEYSLIKLEVSLKSVNMVKQNLRSSMLESHN